MADGLERVSDNEVRLVRNGSPDRSVTLTGGDAPSVTVMRTLRLDPADGDPRDVFDAEVRALQDDWDGTRRCGFCEKTNAEVSTLIAGPTFYICNECVSLCADIMADEQPG